MSTTLAGISKADWLATAAAVRVFILAQQQEIEQLRSQLKRNRSSLDLHRTHRSLSCKFSDQGS
jgi:hypothetical protein